MKTQIVNNFEESIIMESISAANRRRFGIESVNHRITSESNEVVRVISQCIEDGNIFDINEQIDEISNLFKSSY